ncbi:MAG: DsbA family protein [Pseudomonadota bacterium]
MIERMLRNPLWLVLALVISGFVGAALFAAVQRMLPAAVASTDRARIESIVRDYLLEHPEILPQAMERLQAREAQQRDQQAGKEIAANRDRIVAPYPGAFAGNPNGDVTLVAFMDYACGYCRASVPILAQLVAEDSNLRIVYREYPVLSDESIVAARWALAAAEQGKFVPFHVALYSGDRLSDAAIQAALDKAGVDKARARGVIDEPRVSKEIATNRELAEKLGIGGTPSFVIGDRMIPGAVGLDQLRAAIADARKAK